MATLPEITLDFNRQIKLSNNGVLFLLIQVNLSLGNSMRKSDSLKSWLDIYI